MLGSITLWRSSRCSCIARSVVLLTTRFVGIFTSLLIPETKRRTLEEMTGEDHWLNIETGGATSMEGNYEDPEKAT